MKYAFLLHKITSPYQLSIFICQFPFNNQIYKGYTENHRLYNRDLVYYISMI